MGRRAVVLEPEGDAKRRPVVLRQGPRSRDRRKLIDGGLGLVGGLLLLAAVVLVPLLPQDEPVPEQYQVTYEANVIEAPGLGSFDFSDGDAQTIPIIYDGEALYRLEVTVEWTDDIVESRPDVFEVTLTDPRGEVRLGPEVFANPHPAADGNPVAPTYTAQTESRVIPGDIAPRPTTRVITAALDDDLATISGSVAAEQPTNGTGEWTLAVTLIDAGDCPDASSFDRNRVLQCNLASGDGTDPGNAFQVVKVSFTEYLPTVTLLEP